MPLLRATHIIDKPGYLADILSQPCAWGHSLEFCLLREHRIKVLGMDKKQTEKYLEMRRDEILELLNDHLRCSHESK